MVLSRVRQGLKLLRYVFATRERAGSALYVGATLTASILASVTGAGSKFFSSLPVAAHDFFEDQAVTIVLALIGLGLLSFNRQKALSARERSLQHQAHFDVTTRILNRRGFLDTLAKHWPRSAQKPLSLLMFDLDGFKAVNDTYGHAVGDMLLRAIPERVSRWLPKNSVFARLSGDEFAIVVFDGDQDVALNYATKLLADLSIPFDLQDKRAIISTSIGIAQAPKHADQLDELVRKADVALYHSKRTGRNRITLYESEIDAQTTRRTNVEAALRSAVETGGFEPFYQPLVEVRSGALAGFEVLARWNDTSIGPIAPTEFIPVVSNLGLSAPFTEGLIAKALKEANDWKIPARVSFNISPMLFSSAEFVPMMIKLIDQSGIDPQRIDLEVTEDTLITNPEVISDVMFLLKGKGVTFSLDDFGVGYSSLSHLIDIPFDTIKMDRSFVRRATICPRSRELLTAVIGLGRSIGAKVLAEGIETLAERDLIASLGCDLGQGWLFGRPSRTPDFHRAGVRNLTHLRTKSLL